METEQVERVNHTKIIFYAIGAGALTVAALCTPIPGAIACYVGAPSLRYVIGFFAGGVSAYALGLLYEWVKQQYDAGKLQIDPHVHKLLLHLLKSGHCSKVQSRPSSATDFQSDSKSSNEKELVELTITSKPNESSSVSVDATTSASLGAQDFAQVSEPPSASNNSVQQDTSQQQPQHQQQQLGQQSSNMNDQSSCLLLEKLDAIETRLQEFEERQQKKQDAMETKRLKFEERQQGQQDAMETRRLEFEERQQEKQDAMETRRLEFEERLLEKQNEMETRRQNFEERQEENQKRFQREMQEQSLVFQKQMQDQLLAFQTQMQQNMNAFQQQVVTTMTALAPPPQPSEPSPLPTPSQPSNPPTSQTPAPNSADDGGDVITY